MSKKKPTSAVVHQQLGRILEEQGRFAAALPEYQAMARLMPENGYAQYLIGRTLLRLGRTREAELAFDKALQLDGSQVDAWLALARLHARDAGRPDGLRMRPAAGVKVVRTLASLGGRH